MSTPVVPHDGDSAVVGDRFPQFSLGAFNTTPPSSSRGGLFHSHTQLSGTQLENVRPPPIDTTLSHSSHSSGSNNSTRTQRDPSNSSAQHMHMHGMTHAQPSVAAAATSSSSSSSGSGGGGKRQLELDRPAHLRRRLQDSASSSPLGSDSAGSEHRSSCSPFATNAGGHRPTAAAAGSGTDSEHQSASSSRSPGIGPARAHGHTAHTHGHEGRVAYGQGSAIPGPGSSHSPPLRQDALQAQLVAQQRLMLAQQQQIGARLGTHVASQHTSYNRRSNESGSSGGYEHHHASSSTSRSRSSENAYSRRMSKHEIEQSFQMQEQALYAEFQAKQRQLHAQRVAMLTSGTNSPHAASSTMPRDVAQSGSPPLVDNLGAFPHSHSHSNLMSQHGHGLHAASISGGAQNANRPSTMQPQRRQLKPAAIFQQQQQQHRPHTMAIAGVDANVSLEQQQRLHVQQQQLLSHQVAGSGDLLPAQRCVLLRGYL